DEISSSVGRLVHQSFAFADPIWRHSRIPEFWILPFSNQFQIWISILVELGSISQQEALQSGVSDHRRVIAAKRWTGQLQIQSSNGGCLGHFCAKPRICTNASTDGDQIHSNTFGCPNRLLHQNIDDGFLKRGTQIRMKLSFKLRQQIADSGFQSAEAEIEISAFQHAAREIEFFGIS